MHDQESAIRISDSNGNLLVVTRGSMNPRTLIGFLKDCRDQCVSCAEICLHNINEGLSLILRTDEQGRFEAPLKLSAGRPTLVSVAANWNGCRLAASRYL